MMKRLASLLITITLCVALFAQGIPASAASGEATFFLSCTEGNVGDTVTVSVMITGDSGFTNATVYLHYNTAAVEFVKEGVGEVASSCNAMFIANNMPEQGYVKGGYIALYPAIDAGTLLTYKFKVIAYKAAGFSLSFDECQGEDDNGNAFDINYSTTTCVLNEAAGGNESTTAPTKVNNNTTKATTVATKATTTKAGNQPQGSTAASAPTTTATYPTDAHGITLSPEVVTQADGNAVTEAGGAVVTIATTTSTAVSTTTGSTDEQTSDPAVEQTNGWLVPVIVIGVLVLAAGGVTAVMLVMRKKKTEE